MIVMGQYQRAEIPLWRTAQKQAGAWKRDDFSGFDQVASIASQEIERQGVQRPVRHDP